MALIDTDIYSEIKRGVNRRVVAKATSYKIICDYYTISIITVTEIVKGWQKRQREDRIQQFLAELADVEILTLDRDGAELAGRIDADLERAGQPIGLADVIIAATALQHNLTLVTGNTNHYQRIQALGYDLKLDNWRL